MRHEFRIGPAEGLHACNQTQIKDIGILRAAEPRIAVETCSGCGACIEACTAEKMRRFAELVDENLIQSPRSVFL